MDYQAQYDAVLATINASISDSRVKEETIASLQSNNLQMQSSQIFAKKEVTGQGGLLNVIKQSDSLVFGERNIDGAKLSSGELFIATGIAFSWYQGAADSAINNYVNTRNNGTVDVDAALLNSELILGQNSKTLLRTPIESLLANTESDAPAGHPDVIFPLFPFAFLTDRETINLDIQFPEGASVGGTTATAEIWVNIALLGVRTMPR
ncbi:MAG: hypothetical protein AAGI07_00230 [Bacteroidota bacterium]